MTQTVMMMKILKAMAPEEIQLLVEILLVETLLGAVLVLVVTTAMILMAVAMMMIQNLNQMVSSCNVMYQYPMALILF